MDRHKIYRPLLERSLENYQMQHLARKYDFGKQSMISKLIISKINKDIEEAEKSIGVVRVKPFCLYLKKKGEYAILPLFSHKYLKPIFEGKSFNASKSYVAKKLLKIYKKSFPKKNKRDLLQIINPWQQARFRRGSSYKKNFASKPRAYCLADNRKYNKFIKNIKTSSPLERMDILDSSAPQKLIKELTRFVKEEAGFGKILAKKLVEDVISIRSAVCPRTSKLKSGEMPMLTTHVSAKLTEDTDTRYRKLSPVIITVFKKEDLDGFPCPLKEYINTFSKRILRVAFEAYKQNGLLTLAEMQWVFMISATRISEVIRDTEYKHNIIIPTPGTILDAGRSITHKDIIVKLHLEGHNVSEISKITSHSPKSVDNYIGTFEAVLILYLYKMPIPVMSRILGRGISLIKEHIRIIDEVYSDIREIKKDLIRKGVSF